MEPDTCIRPHRHPRTWELLTALRGRFVVLHFDDSGTVNDAGSRYAAVARTPVARAARAFDQRFRLLLFMHA